MTEYRDPRKDKPVKEPAGTGQKMESGEKLQGENALGRVFDRARRLIEVEFAERRGALPEKVNQTLEGFAMIGAADSGGAYKRCHAVYKQEVEIRAKIVWERVQTAHKAVGSPVTETLAEDLKKETNHHIDKIVEEVSEVMVQRLDSMRPPTGHFDLEGTRREVKERTDVEVDLYVDSLVCKPAETEQKAEGSKIMVAARASKTNWEAIRSEYDISKKDFGKKINFVSDPYKRKIIFRDVEHAFVLASHGFAKPAVILAGGVIEELLKQYLSHKKIKPKSDRFVDYIKTCEDNHLLKRGVSRLSDSIRDFRNLVHISREETKRHTISKATAKGAVSSIFTIANDFE